MVDNQVAECTVPGDPAATGARPVLDPVAFSTIHLAFFVDINSFFMIGCVVRELKGGKDGSGGREDYEHMVFCTTRTNLTGRRIIQTYELRPEIEEDHRQWKDGPWDMAEFTSTRLVQVLYHVICVLLAYNLSKLYSNTRAGQEFARKTLRQLRREQARSHEVGVLVFVGSYYAVFDIRFFTGILLRLGQEAVAHLRDHFPMPEMGFT